jgi:beta-glucanase (GH16 family)
VTGPSQFSFGGYTWETHSGSAPPVGNTNGNVGKFDPNNVSIGSELVLSLTQTQSGSTINSSGAEVMTTQTFTYGTFEFTSRVVNVLSGSVMTGFLYASNSITEIDMEQVGNKSDAVDCTNWHGESDFQDTEVTGYDQGNSHDFKIVWQPGYVDWYVDGDLVVHHTQAVPSAAAPFLFSAWGTNKSSWGGTATIGPTRFMYISNFKYTP